MSDRFRLLERDKVETSDEKQSEKAPEPRLQRALEHGEELGLDLSFLEELIRDLCRSGD